MTSSVGQVGLPPINIQTLAYQGPPINYVPCVKANRDPTTADINYNTMCEWTNDQTFDIWKLYGFNNGLADWRLLATGGSSGGGILTLSDDAGVKAPPDGTGDVQLFGGTGITTTTSGTSITIALTGGGVAFQGVTVDDFTPPGTNPVLPNAGGNLVVTGAQVANGVIGLNAMRSDSLAASTITMEIQQTGLSTMKDTGKNGIAHFNQSQFTCDEGYISLVTGTPDAPAISEVNVDTSEGTGTDPVIGDATGAITLTGNQVAANTVGARAMRTDSVAANEIEIQIQRADKSAATDVAKCGICHFDSAAFDIDANGFVTLASGSINIQAINVDAFVPPGTNPVVATAGGEITVGGSLVTAGSTPIQTISLAANAYDIEVQISQAVAASDVSVNGLSHFKDSDFTVDANGFVELVNPNPNYPPFDPDFRHIGYEIYEDFVALTTPSSTAGPFYATLSTIHWHLDSTLTYEEVDHPGIIMNVTSSTLPAFLGWHWYLAYPIANMQIIFATCLKSANVPSLQNTIIGYLPYTYFSPGFAGGAYFTNFRMGSVYYFQCVCVTSAGSTTSVNTSVPLDTDWHGYRITLDTLAATALFYIDDVLVATISTNVPTDRTTFGVRCEKFVATDQVRVDYLYLKFQPYGTRY